MKLPKYTEEELWALLKECRLCPRNCGVNRLEGKQGFCRAIGKEMQVARTALHFWEEPCLSGTAGSGTVFFSHCNMRCVFCQNYEISTQDIGQTIDVDRLVEIFFRLEEQGALNLNLVTPTHYMVQIAIALQRAKQQGFSLPVVYNCSGYESISSLRLLDGLVDIYLPDLKYYDEQLALKYSHATHYFTYAKQAIQEMIRQTGNPVFDSDGRMLSGTIVRHLLLPGQLEDSKTVVHWFTKHWKDQAYFSLMSQYTPLSWVEFYPELNRKVTQEEYDELLEYALQMGLEHVFVQEGEAASESFIPSFLNQTLL